MSEWKEEKEGKVRSNITDGFARRSRRRSCKSFAVLVARMQGRERILAANKQQDFIGMPPQAEDTFLGGKKDSLLAAIIFIFEQRGSRWRYG